jgi:hypothetical protein
MKTPWTFVRTSEFVESRRQFEAQLKAQLAGRAVALDKLKGIAREEEARRITIEAENWEAFNRGVRKYEDGGNDPSTLRLNSEPGSELQDCHAFSSHGYTLLYHCVTKPPTATAVVVCKDPS